MLKSDLPTDSQLQILNIVWNSNDGATVREAKNALEDDRAYTSVLTVFQTLEKNGLVRHEREGKAYRYYATLTRKQVAKRFAEFLDHHGLLGGVKAHDDS